MTSDTSENLTNHSTEGDEKSSTDSCVQTANSLKVKANGFFENQSYQAAIALYTQAIELAPSHILYGNRSIANLRLENFGLALEDANKALEIDPHYVKGYYRRAAAHMALGKWRVALKDFESVCKARPTDKDARSNYSECKKLFRIYSFQRAIAVNSQQQCVSDTIDLESMSIDDNYSGPSLDEDGNVTVDFMIHLMQWFKDQKLLQSKYAFKILLDARSYFMKQPTLVDIEIPEDKKFTICGDIHGQFYDLLNIFEINGLPSEDNPYLFNGDFVDRGSFSCECIFTMLGYKLLYPNHFYMSRGNHESETMNQIYGFDGEVCHKYSKRMAHVFTELYNWLPLCHVLCGRVFVTHGGLFERDGVRLDDLRALERNRQPPEAGLMCDLLWSDPQPQDGRSPSKRGVGTQFGPDVTRKFLADNQLDYMVRSHEVKPDGYEVAHDGQCITVFSAPNYCDTMENKGAFITLNGSDMRPVFTTYKEVPHPAIKPMVYGNVLLNMLG